MGDQEVEHHLEIEGSSIQNSIVSYLFDQRGAGKSTPHARLEENTTWDLVEDIEKIRKHLEIPEWQFADLDGFDISCLLEAVYPCITVPEIGGDLLAFIDMMGSEEQALNPTRQLIVSVPCCPHNTTTCMVFCLDRIPFHVSPPAPTSLAYRGERLTASFSFFAGNISGVLDVCRLIDCWWWKEANGHVITVERVCEIGEGVEFLLQ